MATKDIRLRDNSIIARKQAAWDQVVSLVDYGHGPVSGSGGGFFKETSLTNQCASGDECMGLRAFGNNPPSPANLLYGGNLSLTPTNALVWYKDSGNTTSLAPIYYDKGNFDVYLRMFNGPPNTAYYESNPGAFTAKTHPIDIFFVVRWMPQTSDEGFGGVKSLVATNTTDKLSFIDSYTPDITLDPGMSYNKFTDSLMRVLVRQDQTWEVWLNGLSIGHGSGVSFSTTEWWWGTNSHVLGLHARAIFCKFGVFTEREVGIITDNCRFIWPWNVKPPYPLLTESYYGDATTWDGTTKSWRAGRNKNPIFSGGNGIPGTYLYVPYYFQASDATRFPSPDGVLTNHRQVPPAVFITTMGSGNSLDYVLVDNVNIMSAPVTWTTDMATTGAAIVSNINAFQTAYVAELRTSTILLHPNGLGCNAYHTNAVTVGGTGFTPTKLDAPRAEDFVRTTYAVPNHIFFGHEGDNTISVGIVKYPVDSAGVIGDPMPTRWITDNIP